MVTATVSTGLLKKRQHFIRTKRLSQLKLKSFKTCQKSQKWQLGARKNLSPQDTDKEQD